MKTTGQKTIATYSLIQKDDAKSRHWQEAMAQIGQTLRIMPSSAAYVPIHILRNSWFYGRPQAVVYRYLNDYPSIAKTAIRVCSELLAVSLCVVLRIRLVWICHNVDQESERNRPWLTSFRRRLFRRFSRTILVTDPQLVPAANVLLKCPTKTDFITFGRLQQCPADNGSKQLSRDVEEFVRQERQRFSGPPEKLKIGWLAGSANWKTAHFERVIALLDEAERIGYTLRMVVVLANPKYLKENHPSALESLKTDPRVLFRRGFIEADEHAISKMVDFYWRVYRDLSVPLSVYHAAQQKRPILTQEIGFLAELVRHDRLGVITREDFADLKQSLDALAMWRPEHADRFLASHEWSVGARKLVEACHR